MKLNRKGYLTVEVILASVAAIGIAFFLMEITIKLVNITDDAYVDTDLLTDKALIIENIKALVEEEISNKGKITFNNTGSNCNGKPNCEKYNISFNYTSVAGISFTGGILEYKDSDGNIRYQKKLNKNINNWKVDFKEVIPSGYEKGYVLIKITGDNKFSKNNFRADIIVYNG